MIAYLKYVTPLFLEIATIRSPQFVALFLFPMVVRQEQAARSKRNRSGEGMHAL